MALGSRLPALMEDYKLGRLCGRYFLATVGKLLVNKPPLRRYGTRPVLPVAEPAAVAAALKCWRLSYRNHHRGAAGDRR